MSTDTVVAVCASVIAGASLATSIYQGQATRQHYRRSVRPLLVLQAGFRQDRISGLQLINAGLGPAVLSKTVLTFDGEVLGEFNEVNVNTVRAKLSIRPAAVTFASGEFLAADYDHFLLSVEPFGRDKDAEFVDLVRRRLSLEIQYESLYGGEAYKTEWKPAARRP